MKSKYQSTHNTAIKGLDDVGSIWLANESQRRDTKKLSRVSKRRISHFKSSLARLDRKVDDELMKIKRNMKKPTKQGQREEIDKEGSEGDNLDS